MVKKSLISHRRRLIWVLFLLTFSNVILAQELGNELERGFQTPPNSSFPRTWWHWTNGNITLDGITKDLEWMKEVGIAEFQLADVSFGYGQNVDKKILFGTKEWLEAVHHSAKEADRLDLEMTVFSSAGWSLAGGPWVEPKQAMKKFVWSEIQLEGTMHYSGKLPEPPKVNGPIRNLTYRGLESDSTWYGDQSVIAYPTPKAEINTTKPKFYVNGNPIDGTELIDNDLNSFITIQTNKNDSSECPYVDLVYNEPFTSRAITISSKQGIPFGRLMASSDGKSYEILASFPGPQLYRGGSVRTFAFPEVEAKYFRIEITNAPLIPSDVINQPSPKQLSEKFALSELVLHSGGRVNRWEEKAGFSILFDYSGQNTPEVSSTATIDPSKIIDLTSKLDKEGNINWQVPDGNWTILRTGYSLTGAKNRPAMLTGLGYEVDKLNKTHVLDYMQKYIEPLKNELGSLFGERLKYILLDSWEAGMQNWTENMPEQFLERRGYDMIPYLPVLSGKIVGNSEISDRFLWDFRRTLGDMFAENFYGTVTEFLHKNGIKTYSEAAGVSLEIMEDALLNKKNVDIPMGEFWVRDLHPSSMYHVDVRGAASASHAYGKGIVAAESFTGGGFESPFKLKQIGDYWFTQGVNRIIFHTSTHQPLDTKPGNAMVGTHIHRNITWANHAAPFMLDIARKSYMLQQGLFVADIAYLLDEGAPSTMPFWGNGLNPEPPDGYNYDYVNTDILLNRMSVDESGRIVLPDGMSYQVLVLPGKKQMSVKVLQKLLELVEGGATIWGSKPISTPGLNNYLNSDSTFHRLTYELWGDLDGISRTVRYKGKGMVIWGESLLKALEKSGIEEDIKHSKELDTKISWIHRELGDSDIYFISNQSGTRQNLDFSFRVYGKQPELWNPDDGSIKYISYKLANKRTITPISLFPYQSVFIVFRKEANLNEILLPVIEEKEILTIGGSWEVSFPEGSDAPEKIKMQDLTLLSDNSDAKVKYFSGTALYSNTFHITKDVLKEGIPILIDLGDVKDMAEIEINGHNVGFVWKAPFRLDITEYLNPGANKIVIKVTNQWTNRIVGDLDLPSEEKVIDYEVPLMLRGYLKLQESGLKGPVKIISLK